MQVSSVPYDAVRSRTHRKGRRDLLCLTGSPVRKAVAKQRLCASGPKLLTRRPASRPSVLGSLPTGSGCSPTGPGRCPSCKGKSTYQLLKPFLVVLLGNCSGVVSTIPSVSLRARCTCQKLRTSSYLGLPPHPSRFAPRPHVKHLRLFAPYCHPAQQRGNLPVRRFR